MRHGELLSERESMALIEQIERWCRRTGTNYNKLVVVARVGATTRHKVRVHGHRLTEEVAARLRSAMRQYRYGISRDEYRAVSKPWGGPFNLPAVEPAQSEPIRVVRETCRRCGAILGRCEHFERTAERGIIRA